MSFLWKASVFVFYALRQVFRARRHYSPPAGVFPQLGKVKTAPSDKPSGQRVVVVLRRV